MAIDSHPKFPELVMALSSINDAWDIYSFGVAFSPEGDHSDKEAAFYVAARSFCEIWKRFDSDGRHSG